MKLFTLRGFLENNKKSTYTRVVVRWYRGKEDNDITCYLNSRVALRLITPSYLDSVVTDSKENDNLIIVKVETNPECYIRL